jgi:hypothetical protein
MPPKQIKTRGPDKKSVPDDLKRNKKRQPKLRERKNTKRQEMLLPLLGSLHLFMPVAAPKHLLFLCDLR